MLLIKRIFSEVLKIGLSSAIPQILMSLLLNNMATM